MIGIGRVGGEGGDGDRRGRGLGVWNVRIKLENRCKYDYLKVNA